MIDTGHYYTKTGEPMHFVPRAKGGGTRATTIADARKLELYPGVTTILKAAAKPALVQWLIKQAVYAVVTAPTLPNEGLDDKLVRVLETEKQQDEEAKLAADVGSQIHEAIACAIEEKQWDRSLEAYVLPVLEWVKLTGKVVWTEKVLVGKGYAGRGDLMLDNELINAFILTDFKSTGKLPEKDSWPEHQLQTAAYAAAIGNTGDKRIVTCNVYVSTREPGKMAVFTQDNWFYNFTAGFTPIFQYWQWLNKYYLGDKV